MPSAPPGSRVASYRNSFQFNLDRPYALAGLLLGGILPFLFSVYALEAVKSTRSNLKAKLYWIVTKSSKSDEIERRDRRIRIVSENSADALDQLKPRPGYLQTDSESILHMD